MTSPLARHLATTQGLSPADAEAAVAAFVADVQARSRSGLPVVYPGLGTFALGPDGLAFVPDAGLALVVNHRYAGLDAGAVYSTPDGPFRPAPAVGAVPRFEPLMAPIPPAASPRPAPLSGPSVDAAASPPVPPTVPPRPSAAAEATPRRRSVALPFGLLALVGLLGLALLYVWWQRSSVPDIDATRRDAVPEAQLNRPDSTAADTAARTGETDPGAPPTIASSPTAAAPPTMAAPASSGAAPPSARLTARAPQSAPAVRSRSGTPSPRAVPRPQRSSVRTRPRTASPPRVASPRPVGTRVSPTTQPPADGAALVTPTTDREALVGSAPIDPARGGYTLVAGGRPTAAEAEVLAAPLRAAGWRVGLVEGTTARGTPIVRVCVGQFGEKPQALAALARLRARVLPSDAWMLAL